MVSCIEYKNPTFVECIICNEKIHYWLQNEDKEIKDKEVLIYHLKSDH